MEWEGRGRRGCASQETGQREEFAQLSREELGMRIYAAGLLVLFPIFSVCLSAAEVRGTIVDPSGARVAGARVSVVTPLGVARSFPAPEGAFACSLPEGSKLVVTAAGFADKSIA